MNKKKVKSPKSEEERKTEAPPRQSGRVPIALCAVLILAAGIWAFSNSFTGAFMGDDDHSIVKNPHIQTLFPPVAPAESTLSGRPVASFSFALNYALAPADVRDALEPRDLVGLAQDPADPFYRNVFGYHLFNLIIHLLAALVLFGVIRRTLLSPALSERFGKASSALALAATLIWVVHPLQTAAVTYVVQRVESLMGLFYLLTIYCVVRAAESGFANRRWVAAAIVACALGMGTKESMASAPIVAALWIFICWPGFTLAKGPRLLLLGLVATWLVVIGLSWTPNRALSVGFTLGGWSWWLYLRTQAGVLLHYVQLAFWPAELVFLYQWMPAPASPAVLVQFLVVAALGVATLLGVIRRAPWALLGVWFFLILAPSSSILPIASEVAADHRMYLPLASIIAAVLTGGWWLASQTSIARAPWAKPAAWALVAVIVIALGVRTRARNEDYRSFDIMASTIVAAEPHNVVAQIHVGATFVRRKQFAQGEAHLRQALAFPLPLGATQQPYGMANMMLGISAGAQNRHHEAVEPLQQAIKLDPTLRDPYGLLAESLLKLGRVGEALAALDAGIAAFPDSAQWLARSAWVRATTTDDAARDGARAVKDAEKALAAAKGSDLLMLVSLAAAQAETRDFAAALRTLASAEARAGQNADMRARLQAYRAYFEAKQPIRIAHW